MNLGFSKCQLITCVWNTYSIADISISLSSTKFSIMDREYIGNTWLALEGTRCAVGARLSIHVWKSSLVMKELWEWGLYSSLGGHHHWVGMFHRPTVLFPIAICWPCWCVPNCMSFNTDNISILLTSSLDIHFNWFSPKCLQRNHKKSVIKITQMFFGKPIHELKTMHGVSDQHLKWC